MPDLPISAKEKPERLGSFRLYEYEIPLLLQIRQARKSAAATTRRFLIEVEGDHIYLIEIPISTRAALA